MTDDGWNASVDRRDFVRSLFGAVAIAALQPPMRKPLAVGILRDRSRSSFADGIALGLMEADRTQSLFNRKVMTRLEGSGAQSFISNGAAVIVGRAGDTEAERIAGACNKGSVVYLDCGTRSDSFRQRCDPFVFHIEASDAMYRNALHLSGGVNVELWDSSLERYGAAQLNDRFRSHAGRPMDADAWRGWFAIKVIVESALRMRGNTGAALRNYLSATTTELDGHKGAPLSFRSWDHQLRQPLYSLRPGEPARDIPDVARSEGSIRDLLDSIGDASAACKVSR